MELTQCVVYSEFRKEAKWNFVEEASVLKIIMRHMSSLSVLFSSATLKTRQSTFEYYPFSGTRSRAPPAFEAQHLTTKVKVPLPPKRSVPRN